MTYWQVKNDSMELIRIHEDGDCGDAMEDFLEPFVYKVYAFKTFTLNILT